MARVIWIVEDDAGVSSSLQTLLHHSGYEALVFRNGNSVLAGASSSPPGLMLLDLNLPDMDGLEVCRRVRAWPAYVPVIMLTARDESIDRLIGFEAGADVYLTKPFDPHELLAQIKALFRLVDRFSDRDQRGLPLACGPLVLWESAHRVELNGNPIALTPKEFELLKVLMQHPGRVFGRETLLNSVWKYDFDGDTRTVDMHVQRLRGKIEEDPSEPRLLLTVRGFGYKLAATEDAP